MGQTLTENQPCEAIIDQRQSFDCLHKKEKSGTPKLELADVFLQFWEDYANEFDVSSTQQRVMSDITGCRTPAMGWKLEQCNDCNQERQVDDSCRNRYCPKCGLLTRAEWREKRQAEIMPIDYYHVVNKAPGIEGIAHDNPELVLDLLLSAQAEALKTIAQIPSISERRSVSTNSFIHLHRC